ncbi:hypothetical protein F2P81_004614 [Scophthalmus maximus]|uniref:Uncharacterized protein n=1 Tax=Scophthalmus maximus TaxID=52904 RepID=A0A6A4TA24_SCOMX|nr:hypothetical protein F2P81_004614 [Scophthalmus maximus]
MPKPSVHSIRITRAPLWDPGREESGRLSTGKHLTTHTHEVRNTLLRRCREVNAVASDCRLKINSDMYIGNKK